MSCLIGAKHTMLATLLRQTPDYSEPDTDPAFEGEWVDSQDPLTGQIVRVWEPAHEIPDNPSTPEYDPSTATIPCVARGYSSSNRYTSNQTFGEDYKNIDAVRLWLPTWVHITKGDRVTNIRTADGHIMWIEDFYKGGLRAASFNVAGVVPQFGPFNMHVETFVVLERAEAATNG